MFVEVFERNDVNDYPVTYKSGPFVIGPDDWYLVKIKIGASSRERLVIASKFDGEGIAIYCQVTDIDGGYVDAAVFVNQFEVFELIKLIEKE